MFTSQSFARSALALSAVALIGSTLTGCGSSSGSSSGSGGTDSAQVTAAQKTVDSFTAAVTSYPAVTPVSGVSALKGKTVWWVPFGTNPVLEGMGAGVQAALAKAGITVHTCAGQFTPTSAAACLEQATAQGASGVVTGYIDYALVKNAYDALATKGIPVLLAGVAAPAGFSNKKFAFNHSLAMNSQDQVAMLTEAIADSKGSANILYLGVNDSPVMAASGKYATSYTAKNCSGCTYHEVDYNTASSAKLSSQVSSALVSNPDTTYVLCQTAACAAPAIEGIRTASYTNKVKVISSGGAVDSLQRISAGNSPQIADAGVNQIYQGWTFADGLLRLMAGEKVPESTAGGIRLFTKKNISGLKLTSAAALTDEWYGSSSYEDDFLTAWGLK
ncbi:substrate-binding domain-containing protein [Streptomyces sp. NPDC095613]|uniref:sugar ABC transporter substrate-binding protein n=1 Tax=Streptomyces sp. NPDC095613 TaxID=3155540 RepID=UPI00331D9867